MALDAAIAAASAAVTTSVGASDDRVSFVSDVLVQTPLRSA